jgi:response regulator RpfG family c-di-GMP phosphodiesterase
MNNDSFELSKLNYDFLLDQHQTKKKTKKHKILIVDDDYEVHRITEIALRNLEFEERSLEFINAYSSQEAFKILNEIDDIEVILLDVVMESEDAGLKLVKRIRDELKNYKVRIILRTGHPGIAPEKNIVIDYDINDYKAKTDLTAIGLTTSVISSLRSYRDIFRLESNRNGLKKVIDSTSSLFNYESLGITTFLTGILAQLSSIVDADDSMVLVNRHFENNRLIIHESNFIVISATGNLSKYINKSYDEIKDKLNLPDIQGIIGGKTCCNYYLDLHKPMFKNHTESYIFMINGDFTKENEDFIKIFLKNLSLALDNFLLEQDSDEALKEILIRISNILEQRDMSTGEHVNRVAKIVSIMASKLDFNKIEMENIYTASIMHDVGKVGISEEILLKPGPLTPEEFEIIKEHTTIGGKVFDGSNFELLKLAHIIALYHHERWDGKGYPTGLKGEHIPIIARIVSVADVFEALTHDRVYKKAWDKERAKAYILENSGIMFDEKIVKIFEKVYDEISEVD